MKRLVATALLLLSGLPALANWPDKPIRIIVGSSPGGYLDVITRAVAKELSAEWGQPIVIQNVPGASGSIAAQTVAKAAPDGYTWLASTEAHIVTNRFLMKNLAYGQGYQYAHDFPGHFIDQQFLPDSLDGHIFYDPSAQGAEAALRARLAAWWPARYKYGKQEE